MTASDLIRRATIRSDTPCLPPAIFFNRKFHIVDDIEVNITIGIVVEKGTTCAPACIANPSLLCPIGKSAVPVVRIKPIMPIVRYVDVGVTIVINICSGASDPITGISDTRLLRDVDESAIAVIAIESVFWEMSVRMFFINGWWDMRRIHYVKVESPIKVKVKKECPGSERFNQIFFAGSPINMLK